MTSEQGRACQQLWGVCHSPPPCRAASCETRARFQLSGASYTTPVPGLVLWLGCCIETEPASSWRRAFNTRGDLHAVFAACLFCFTPAGSSANAEPVPFLLIDLSYWPKMHELLLGATSLFVCSGFADSKIVTGCCFHCDFSWWKSVTGIFEIFFTSQNEE